MSWLWVICGAGRQVGKTHIARRLCDILPNAVYAKQGHGEKRPDKPDNFFHSEDELATFVADAQQAHDHVVVESNELARAGRGDVIIFVDGIPGQTDYRDDADRLRSNAHLHTGRDVTTREWERVLHCRLGSDQLCAKIAELLADQQGFAGQASPALRRVAPVRLSTTGGPAVRDRGDVIIEQLVTIMVESVGSFTLMCTPCDVEALAIGFALSEGLITSMDDVVECVYRREEQTIGLRVDDPGRVTTKRNLIVTSSCGLCGSRNLERLLDGDERSGDSLRLPASVLRSVAQRMRSRQALFHRTGGAHAAGIFDASGTLLTVAEDIGRHNALDKAIGKCLIKGVPLAGCAAVLSGRVSLELVVKAVRARLELLAAVSAPSSLAIDVAEHCNITLCAFVREDRATAYTHPQRIEGLEA